MPISSRFVPLNPRPAQGLANPRFTPWQRFAPDYGYTSEAPDPTANNDPEGVSGSAPGTMGAALSGAQSGGLIGQTLGDLGVPGGLQGAGATAVTTALGATGVPGLPITLANRLFGAAKRAAEHNLRQAGRRVAPIELNGPRTIPDTPPPNASFDDPANLGDIGGTPATPGTGAIAAPPSFTVDMTLGLGPIPDPPNPNMELVDLPDVDSFTAQVDAAIAAAAAAQAQADAISAAIASMGDDGSGPGNSSDGPGSDTGGVGGVWQHGGPVHGPGGIDNVRGRLTAGEYVLDKDSAQRFRPLVEMLNSWEQGDPVPRGLQGLLHRGRQ